MFEIKLPYNDMQRKEKIIIQKISVDLTMELDTN